MLANLYMFVVQALMYPGRCEKCEDDVIDRQVHMVFSLTVLITHTFFCRGNIKRNPPKEAKLTTKETYLSTENILLYISGLSERFSISGASDQQQPLTL